MSELFVSGFIAHLIADWFLQNDWMAVNKVRWPLGLAGWVHGAIHFAAMLFVFPWQIAFAIAATHMVIDTRIPLNAWQRFYGQAKDGNPVANHVRIWSDQVAHIVIVYFAAVVAS